ncbi:MAG: hypothetical protein ABSG60_09075 [Terracidiphilus sp.]
MAWSGFAFAKEGVQMFDRFKSAVRNRQRLKWEKQRKHGKRSFIVYRGVLKWGGTMFILTTITSFVLRRDTLNWLLVVSTLIACPLAGYIWARCTWFVNENRFYGVTKRPLSIMRK